MINYAVTDLVYLSQSNSDGKNSALIISPTIRTGAFILCSLVRFTILNGTTRNPLPILSCAPHFREHPQIYTERIEHKEMGHTRRRAPIQKCLGGAKEGAWPTRNQSEQCGRINQRPVSVLFGGAGDDREAKKPKSRLVVNWRKAIFWRG